MKFRITTTIGLLLGIAYPVLLFAQSDLVVTPANNPGITPQELVQSYLIGKGITISNVTFNGSSAIITSQQVGSFFAGASTNSELGMEEGVIISSGKVSAASGNANLPLASTPFGLSGDQDLDMLSAPATTKDKSVIEFDFIPESSTLSFKYVFGSEEFYQFCNQYNDPFGFFLSGPGINGPFSNGGVNIALMPDSPNPVTINTICANSSVNWCNNPSIVTTWQDCSKAIGKNMAYNGLTYVFTATYTIIPCSTYHIKLAVADAGDDQYDSGVFLEKNSFSSNIISANTTYSLNIGQFAVKGCSDANVEFTIPQPEANPVTINYQILGTAVNGVDYTTIPSFVVIPAGQTSVTLIIDPLPDPIPFEPDKTVIIRITQTTCNGPIITETTVIIKDNNPLSATVNSPAICSGGNATITITPVGGQSPFSYQWNTGASTATITVSPPPGITLYTVLVTDVCGQSATQTSTVSVGTSPGAAGPITGQSTLCTPAYGLIYSIPAIPGADAYLWALPSGATITSGINTCTITVDFSSASTSGNVTVLGRSSFCGDGPTATLPLVIHPSPQAAGPITGMVNVCQGPSQVTYSINPLSYTDSYEWSVPPGTTIVNGATSNQITCIFSYAASSGNFTVRGDNADCGYGASSTLSVTINPLPGNAGTILSPGGSSVCQRQTGVKYMVHPISNSVDYIWSYSGSGATFTINGPILYIDFSATATSGDLTVKGRNSCGDGSMSPLFHIIIKPVPTVEFGICNTIKTTKNGRPIQLKGGRPLGINGVYSGTGVSLNSQGYYVFDPGNSTVAGGSSLTGIDYPVMYRYTNVQGCFDDKAIAITVYGSNANDPCPGTLKDHRDGRNYPTFMAGTGANARCWMGSNLNYGTFTSDNVVQTDNCEIEKYCKSDIELQCESSGGLYQWGEIMEYQEISGYQDLCPPGWHIATPTDWDLLITAFQGSGIAGGALKDPSGTTGFHGLLEGIYYLNTLWAFTSGTTTGTMFWTSGTLPDGRALARGLNYLNISVSSYPASRGNAFPVRCVRN
jgi:uncharacterized protein (TIGR02145 family)